MTEYPTPTIGALVLDGQGDQGEVVRIYTEDGATYAVVQYEAETFTGQFELDWLASDLRPAPATGYEAGTLVWLVQYRSTWTAGWVTTFNKAGAYATFDSPADAGRRMTELADRFPTTAYRVVPDRATWLTMVRDLIREHGVDPADIERDTGNMLDDYDAYANRVNEFVAELVSAIRE